MRGVPSSSVSRASLQLSPSQALSPKPSLLSGYNMSEYFNNMLSYLRIPVLASSGIAVALSGLLYFKQTYALVVNID
jgi:hypothetical protein